MTLLDKMKEIAEAACPRLTWYYDIRQMQNVTADDGKFPAIFMEEYYASTLREGYGWRREVTVELHFLDLVPMHGEARHVNVREWPMANGRAVPAHAERRPVGSVLDSDGMSV